MSYLCVSVLLCTVTLLPLSIAAISSTVSHSGSESGEEGSHDSLEDTVSRTELENTYILPYWNMWSSDFYGWMEELRAQGAYDAMLDLARTYWAHFPGYDSITYLGESEYSDN